MTKKEQKPSVAKKVMAVVGSIALIGLGAGAHAVLSPTPEPIMVPQIEYINQTVTEFVDREVPVNVSVEVPVLNPVNEALVEFIQEELDEDITADYVVWESEAIMETEAFIRTSMIKLLDDEDFGMESFDNELNDYRKSEISIKKISEADVEREDVEDKDLDISYEVKIKAKESGESSEYFSYKIDFEIRDGMFSNDDVSIELIE